MNLRVPGVLVNSRDRGSQSDMKSQEAKEQTSAEEAKVTRETEEASKRRGS